MLTLKHAAVSLLLTMYAGHCYRRQKNNRHFECQREYSNTTQDSFCSTMPLPQSSPPGQGHLHGQRQHRDGRLSACPRSSATVQCTVVPPQLAAGQSSQLLHACGIDRSKQLSLALRAGQTHRRPLHLRLHQGSRPRRQAVAARGDNNKTKESVFTRCVVRSDVERAMSVVSPVPSAA